jgi:hypothetical protein
MRRTKSVEVQESQTVGWLGFLFGGIKSPNRQAATALSTSIAR